MLVCEWSIKTLCTAAVVSLFVLSQTKPLQRTLEKTQQAAQGTKASLTSRSLQQNPAQGGRGICLDLLGRQKQKPAERGRRTTVQFYILYLTTLKPDVGVSLTRIMLQCETLPTRPGPDSSDTVRCSYVKKATGYKESQPWERSLSGLNPSAHTWWTTPPL